METNGECSYGINDATHTYATTTRARTAPQHWAESGMANVMDARVQTENGGGRISGVHPYIPFPLYFDLRTECSLFCVFVLIYGI